MTRALFISFYLFVFANMGNSSWAQTSLDEQDSQNNPNVKEETKKLELQKLNPQKPKANSNTQFGPVIFYQPPRDPSDPYPKDLIYDVMNPEYGSYRVCYQGKCQWVRNFGHDDNVRSAFEEFIIHRGRQER